MRTWARGILAGALAGWLVGALVGSYVAVLVERWPHQGLVWLLLESVFTWTEKGLTAGALVGALACLPPVARRTRWSLLVWTLGACALAAEWSLGGRQLVEVRATTATSTLVLAALGSAALGLAVGWVLTRWVRSERFPTRTVLVVTAILLVGSRAAPFARPRAEGPTLVLISVDTLRANRLGCYGYAAARTPNIDSLAAGGRLWETTIATAPITLPSMSTLMTGLDPQEHGVRYNGYFKLRRDALTLGEVLRERGYDTAAVIGNYVLERAFQIDQGFAHFDDAMTQPMEPHDAEERPERERSRPDTFWNRQLLEGKGQRFADEVTDAALEWLEGQEGEPFFLWVHYMDPHMPYDPPTGYREFGDPYDGEVAFVDAQIGRLLAGLRELELEDLVVAFVSDHGELLPGERGRGRGHVRFLYDVTVHIPFVVHAPGRIAAGERIARPLRARAVPRAILDVLGVEAPASFARPLEGEWVSYAESFQPLIKENGSPLRMVRSSSWKLIRQVDGVLELYDLANDPEERNNLAGSAPPQLAELSALLERESDEAGSVTVEDIDAATRQMMVELGYVDDGDDEDE